MPKVLNISRATKTGWSDFAKASSGSRTVTFPTSQTSKSAINKQKKTARDLTRGIANVFDPKNPKRMFNMMRDSLTSKSCACQNCPMQPTTSKPMDTPEIDPPRNELEPLLAPWPPRPLIVLPTQRTRQTVVLLVGNTQPQNELDSLDDDANNIFTPMDTKMQSPITESKLLMTPQPSQPQQTDLPMQAHGASAVTPVSPLNCSTNYNFDNESGNKSDPQHSPKKLCGQESIHDLYFEAQVIYEVELLEKEPKLLVTKVEPNDDSSSDNEEPMESKTSTRRPPVRTKRHQGYQNCRKSMHWKTIDKRGKDLAALKQDLGQACITHLKTLKTPANCCPFLAAVVHKHCWKTACALLNLNISNQEWWRIGIHSRYPGAFKPVEKEQIFCCCVDSDILRELVSFLTSPGNLQQYAFGMQVCEILGGTESVQLNNVSRMKNLDKLVGNFIVSVIGEMDAMLTHDLPEPENCCTCLQRHSMRQCIQEQNHSGKCKFTPKGSVSASTIQDLIQSFTAGDIKSLSGLDDVWVLKDQDNFKAQQEITKNACNHEDVNTMVKKIDACEIFYQIDYVPHLARVGSHRCNCLTCGSNDSGRSYVLFVVMSGFAPYPLTHLTQ